MTPMGVIFRSVFTGQVGPVAAPHFRKTNARPGG
jgi:hypothetical protein